MTERLMTWQYVRNTRTWLAKAAARIHGDAARARTDDDRKWGVGSNAQELLMAALDAAAEVAPYLNEEDLEDAARRASAVARRLRDRVLVSKLERVDGRTPEEAEAFARKADELRGRW